MHRVVPWGRHLIVEPLAAHNATLVWMHGLGDSAQGFVDVFSDPRFTLPGLKTVLLTADEHPVTLNGGMVMNSWYDITTLTNRTMGNDAVESARKVSSIMLEEAKTTNNLFVGGFSQGGAMSLLLAYSLFPGIVRGVVALSCYCFPITIPEERKQIPALIYHGDADDVVQPRFAQQSYHQSLSGVNYTFKTVPNMSHSVDMQELLDVKKWLDHAIADNPTKL